MSERPNLTLIDCLKQSLAETPDVPDASKPVDLNLERLARKELAAEDVTPAQLLKLVLRDVEHNKNAVKCYVTLVADDGDAFTVSNYRAGMSRSEEVAFRQLGLQEAVDHWRFGPGE